MSFFIYFLLSISLSLAGNRVALPGQGTAAARAALPSPIRVCSIFVCPDNGMAACVPDF